MNIRMNKKAISIIGCGWLGLPLGAFLVDNGFDVKGSTTRKEKLSLLQKNGIIPFSIKVGQTLEGEDVDSFFQSEILLINIPPTRHNTDIENGYQTAIQNIIEKAQSGAIEKIIFVSTTGVYGNSNKILTEEDIPQPESAT